MTSAAAGGQSSRRSADRAGLIAAYLMSVPDTAKSYESMSGPDIARPYARMSVPDIAGQNNRQHPIV
eukprot:3120112-Rhodomonas_salina.5